MAEGVENRAWLMASLARAASIAWSSLVAMVGVSRRRRLYPLGEKG